MSDGGFEKVSQSDERMYGPRKLLLCGFSGDIQPHVVKLLEILKLSDIPRIWVTAEHAGSLISDVLALDDNAGRGLASELPRAIIMSGLTRNELHLLMSGSREAGMKPPLWATLTPTSESWSVQDLLKELAAEHAAMQRRKP
ncbi:MAG: DUF3783 domain-containing protein [Deltaproteobacteria bacterium]|jgi:hypothetical protein|nr:DUF3783 domain-containing protein [Deltaproteobacteria bacterium]